MPDRVTDEELNLLIAILDRDREHQVNIFPVERLQAVRALAELRERRAADSRKEEVRVHTVCAHCRREEGHACQSRIKDERWLISENGGTLAAGLRHALQGAPDAQ